MPTRGGLLLGVSSVVTLVAGRLLGLRELYLIGAGGITLLAGAVIYVRLCGVAVAAHRQLAPGRVQAGTSCRVRLTITNRGRRPSPPLVATDGREGRSIIEPLVADEAAAIAYHLQPARRGLRVVGPLVLQVQDPFGVAARDVAVLAPSTLIVHPRVDHVELPPESRGPSGGNGAPRSAPSPLPGGDLHSLRPYEEGDDLRLVHWPTSARLDTLVVRQDEVPRLRQTVVALDLRRSIHDGGTLERSVSAAASVASAAVEDEGTVGMVTTGGLKVVSAGGEGHLGDILDLLATVDVDRERELSSLIAALAETDGSAVVLITTNAAAAADLRAVARLRPTHPLVAGVVFNLERRETPSRGALRPFDRAVVVEPMAPFDVAWARAMRAGTEG